MRQRPLLTAWVAVLSTSLAAQQVPIVPVSTELVQIDVVVTDKSGRAVADLKPEEFEVSEGGKARAVSHLSYVVTGSAPRGEKPAPPSPPEPAPATNAPDVAPRTIAIVVDDLNLSSESLGHARKQLESFLDDNVQPGDRVALLRTGAGLSALQGFTADHRKLRSAVERLRWNPLSGRVQSIDTVEEGSREQLRAGIGLDPHGYGETADVQRRELLARATIGSLKTIVQALRRLPGRKAMVLVSDGLRMTGQQGLTDANRKGDPAASVGGRSTAAAQSSLAAPSDALGLGDLVQMANEGSVALYPIDARGLQITAFSAADEYNRTNESGTTTEPIFAAQGISTLDDRETTYRRDQDALRILAADTGGFLVHDSALDHGLERVYGDQRGYYLLGFAPDDPAGTGRFRNVVVKVTRPGLVVRARSRYWDGPMQLAPVAGTNIEQFSAAFKDPFDSNDVPLRMMPLVGRDGEGAFFVRSLVHVDASTLTFVERTPGRFEAEVEVVGLARRDDGGAEAESDTTQEIHAETQDGVERLKRNGAVIVVTLTLAKPGFQQIRVAVRDKATSRIGWASEVVEVPNLKKSKLALSGLVLGQEGVDPLRSGAVRRFRAGSELRANFIVFGSKPDDAKKSPTPVVEWRLTREGAEPAGQGSLPLGVGANANVAKGLPGEARLAIPQGAAPGDYALEIAIKGLEKSPLRQWADITIEEPEAN